MKYLLHVPMGCLYLIDKFSAFPNAERNGIAAIPNSTSKIFVTLAFGFLNPAVRLNFLHLSKSSCDIKYIRSSSGQMSTDMIRDDDEGEDLFLTPNAWLFYELRLHQVFETSFSKELVRKMFSRSFQHCLHLCKVEHKSRSSYEGAVASFVAPRSLAGHCQPNRADQGCYRTDSTNPFRSFPVEWESNKYVKCRANAQQGKNRQEDGADKPEHVFFHLFPCKCLRAERGADLDSGRGAGPDDARGVPRMKQLLQCKGLVSSHKNRPGLPNAPIKHGEVHCLGWKTTFFKLSDDVLKVSYAVNHFPQATHHIRSSELVRGDRVKIIPDLGDDNLDHFNLDFSSSGVSCLAREGLRTVSQLTPCFTHEYSNCTSAAYAFPELGFNNQVPGMAILSAHHEDCDPESGYRSDSLNPRGPVRFSKVVSTAEKY